jgi:hypothetical protein
MIIWFLKKLYMSSLPANKHYIGTISATKFYYKNAILAYYNINRLHNILPIYLVNQIVSYICTSLDVFSTNDTIHYVNPSDNALIKSIPLNKIRNLNSNNKFAISEDGLTFYRAYKRTMEFEYLCDEVPDNNKPLGKIVFGNRYYHSYNIIQKCKVSSSVYPSEQYFWKTNDDDKYFLSQDGKYIVTCASKTNVINRSGSYIAIYDAKTRKFIKEFKVDANEIVSLSLSPDNKNLIAITCIQKIQTSWMWNING